MKDGQLITSGDIAEALGLTPDAVRHILANRRILPRQRAGIVRLFDRSVIDQVRGIVAERGEINLTPRAPGISRGLAHPLAGGIQA